MPLHCARRDHGEDPGLCDRVFELLEDTFPGVGQARAAAAAFGATWESASTPFVVEEDGTLLCHVGLLGLPLHAAGQPVRAGGVHGVVTRPSARRRGHFRRAMEELLAHAEGRYEALVLTTLHPEYFEPFGFEVLPEHVFTAVPAGRPQVPTGGAVRARRLDLGAAADRDLVHRLLEARQPVSERFGVGPEKAVWAFYEAAGELRYAEHLDLVAVVERAGTTLRLYDLVAPQVPPLGAVLDALGGRVERVVAFFCPDRLGGPFAAAPHDLTGGPDALEPGEPQTVLMARGALPLDGSPVMLPHPARC